MRSHGMTHRPIRRLAIAQDEVSLLVALAACAVCCGLLIGLRLVPLLLVG